MKKAFYITLLAHLFLLSQAFAEEIDSPPAPTGLWEIRTRIEPNILGTPENRVQYCTEKPINVMLTEHANRSLGKNNPCETAIIQNTVNNIEFLSKCNTNTQSMTRFMLHGKYTATSKTRYTGVLLISASPSTAGMPNLRANQIIEWVGPCQWGQKNEDITKMNTPRKNTR